MAAGRLVVGSVVELREHLSWFERGPFFGKQSSLPGPGTANDLYHAWKTWEPPASSSQPFAWPPLPVGKNLDQAIHSLATFDWVLFTSPKVWGPFSIG